MHKDSTLMELDIMYLQASQNSALGGFTFHFFVLRGFFWGGGCV